jgi:hypothetical protein
VNIGKKSHAKIIALGLQTVRQPDSLRSSSPNTSTASNINANVDKVSF